MLCSSASCARTRYAEGKGVTWLIGLLHRGVEGPGACPPPSVACVGTLAAACHSNLCSATPWRGWPPSCWRSCQAR